MNIRFVTNHTQARNICLPHLFLAFLLGFAVSVWALELRDAKEQGLVGETPSGYLEAVGIATQEVSDLLKNINLQRREEYQRIATKNNISLSDVEALAGKKAIEKTPPGQYVKIDGQWVKK